MYILPIKTMPIKTTFAGKACVINSGLSRLAASSHILVIVSLDSGCSVAQKFLSCEFLKNVQVFVWINSGVLHVATFKYSLHKLSETV